MPVQSDRSNESKVEKAKRESNYLRGTIAEVLDSNRESFEYADQQILKFHGAYQETDRDQSGGNKKHWFMVRTTLPGGLLSAAQYLALDDLADYVTYNKSLRITTRQDLQFHGVLKENLRGTIADINEALITTFAACGDGPRNVVCSPVPVRNAAHDAVRALATTIAKELQPQTNAYHEIWLDGEKVETAQEEPFYGQQYLPRKFKVGIALPEDNSIQVQTQDLGMVAVVANGELQGCNLLVGGGMGLSHGEEDTFARLGSPLGYVARENLIDVVWAILELFRDCGDRSNRKGARLKYLVESWGIDRFRESVEERTGFPLDPPIDVGPLRHNDYLGPHPQGDGSYFYGIFIENGRIIDRENERLKTALREVVEQHQPRVILSPAQDLFLADLGEEALPAVEETLRKHGVRLSGDLSAARRYSMACSAFPTCGMARTAAERVMPGIIDELEAELIRLDLDGLPLTVRTGGCSNGCPRPYTADIAFVGRRMDTYDIYVGGSLHGHRLVDLYEAMVDRADLIASLRPLLEAWSEGRNGEESLGDFYQRTWGRGEPRTLLTGSKDHPVRSTIVESRDKT